MREEEQRRLNKSGVYQKVNRKYKSRANHGGVLFRFVGCKISDFLLNYHSPCREIMFIVWEAAGAGRAV